MGNISGTPRTLEPLITTGGGGGISCTPHFYGSYFKDPFLMDSVDPCHLTIINLVLRVRVLSIITSATPVRIQCCDNGGLKSAFL